jgi:hypothetical protein
VNPTVSAPTVAPLLFNWEAPRRRKVAIAGFLAASVIAHAVCFYLFQIVYPPTVALLPAPARVSLVSPNSEEGRTLLRWIEAEDPALASTTLRPQEAKAHALPKVQHLPSYAGYEPGLKEPPPLVVDLRMPGAQPSGAVPMNHPNIPPVSRVAPTVVSFSREIENLGPVSVPSAKFAASNGEPPEQVRFRVGVSSAGDIRYCFPVNSSGDPALDEQARHYLVLCRFPTRPATEQTPGESMVWGVATIEWGNDIAPAPATSTTMGTP